MSSTVLAWYTAGQEGTEVEDLRQFLKGLSISQVARLSAIDRSSLSRKLNGHTKITAREAMDVSSIVGCDVNKLISWIESRKQLAGS